MKCVLYSPVIKLIEYYTATSIKVTFLSHQRFDIYLWSSLFLFERNREKEEKKDPCDNDELRAEELRPQLPQRKYFSYFT